MKKYTIEIRWAIFFTLMMLIWIIIEKLTGLYTSHIDKHALYTNFIILPAVLIYVLALLDKKNNFYGGVITYKQGFQSGVVLSMVIALISPLTQLISNYLIAPEFFPNMIKHVVSNGQMTQLDADKYFNIKSFIIEGLMGSFVMGVVTTAIIVLFISKKNTAVTK